MKIKNIIDDGFNPELVETALFDGILEFPIIEKPNKIIIPDKMLPFSKIAQSNDYEEGLVFYEPDIEFSDVLRRPEHYLEQLKKFKCIIALDNSLYVDSPLTAQIANAYRSRAIAYYYQKNGCYVIPNVRWGDERSYTTDFLPERFAFLGLPKHSIVSIGTYGCSQSKEEKYQLENGLFAILNELEPEIVLVYGSMNDKIFNKFKSKTRFINYPDWSTYKHSLKEASNGHK